MTITYSSVDCCELQDSKREGATITGLTASVTLVVPYTNRFALMFDLLYGNGGSGKYWPYGGNLVCQNVQAQDGPPGQAQYGTNGQGYDVVLSYVNATYGSPSANPNQPDAGNVTENLEPTCEFITLPHTDYFWFNGGDPEWLKPEEAPGKQLRGLNYVRTLSKVSPPLDSAILDLVGKVNASTVTSTSLGLSFPSETLLYKPPSLSRTLPVDPEDTDLAWNITLRFGYKEGGWNKFWRASTGIWDEIKCMKTDAIYKNYPTGDFIVFF